MSFRYPWLLLLLLLVPLLVYLKYAPRRRSNLLFSTGHALAALPKSWAVRAAWLPPVMYMSGLILLILSAARPQRGLEESRVLTEAVDIVLLVDVSPSMDAIDFSESDLNPRNRLDAAKSVIETFIENRNTDRIGLVAFAAFPYTVSPLTLDHVWLISQMKRLSTDMLQDGSGHSTAIGTGLAYAINRLRDSKAESKLVVLLTDGVNNAGSVTPINAGLLAQAMNVKVYTVGAGATGQVRLPRRDRNGNYVRFRGKLQTDAFPSVIDEPTLKNIAETTGGKFFRAGEFQALEQVFKEIDALEKTEVEIEAYTRYEEQFMPFTLWAMVLLILERLCSLGRLGRLI